MKADGGMTITARICNLLANGVPRGQIMSLLADRGYKPGSVAPLISHLVRHGHDGYLARRLRARRARGICDRQTASAIKHAHARAVRDPVIIANYGKMSACEIAKHLGVTRNAVIGRANRMGLKA